MTKMEIRTNVKTTVAEQFTEFFTNAVQIDDFTYVIPMGTAEDNGRPLFAKVEISCPNWYATAKTEPFDIDAKVEAYNAELTERAEKAAEKARKAAEKEAKRKEKEGE